MRYYEVINKEEIEAPKSANLILLQHLTCPNCGDVQKATISRINKHVAEGYIINVILCRSCNNKIASATYVLKSVSFEEKKEVKE